MPDNLNPAVALSVTGLSFAISGTELIHPMDFKVKSGRRLVVLGPNGAGKSTLLLHLNGYLMPAHGEVCIGGALLTRQSAAAVRRAVGMVFQDPDDQLFMPTVFEDVAFGPLNAGLPADEVESVVKSLKKKE
jgi:cobalt/nickel transport system ATP-binding protein